MQSHLENDVVRHYSRGTGLIGDAFAVVSTIPHVRSHPLGVRGPEMQDNVHGAATHLEKSSP